MSCGQQVIGIMGGQQLFPQRKETLKATSFLLVRDANIVDNPRGVPDDKCPVVFTVDNSDFLIILCNSFKQIIVLCCCSLVHQNIWMTKQDSIVHQAALHAHI